MYGSNAVLEIPETFASCSTEQIGIQCRLQVGVVQADGEVKLRRILGLEKSLKNPSCVVGQIISIS